MAIISDFQVDNEPVSHSSASSSSSRSWKKRKYSTQFHPTNPLGFLMEVFEFMSENCDFLEMDSSERHIATVLQAVRERSKKRKVAEEEEAAKVKAKAKAKSMNKEMEEKTEAVTEEAKKTIKIEK